MSPQQGHSHTESSHSHDDHDDGDGILPSARHHVHTLLDGVHHEGESGRSGFQIQHFLKVTWISSCVVSQWVNLLWPFVPVVIVLRLVSPDQAKCIFALAYLAMIPCANLIGFAGQELARKLPKVSGILIETAIGGVVEIILFLILIYTHDDTAGNADEGNLIPIIQAAILGSILTNLLLCLGLVFYFGGLRQRVQTFHAVVSETGTGLLLVAGFGLLIPSTYYSALKGETVVSLVLGHSPKFTNELLEDNVVSISRATSLVLMLAFVAYIWYNARSSDSIFNEVLEADESKDTDRELDLEKPKYTFTECIFALIISLTLVTLMAIFLVEQIEDIVEAGVPDQFLGLILIPLVEKAAEHLTAIDEAWDGQMNAALYHCLGPSIQTALFNAPFVVIVSWIMGKKMDLNFEIFMIALLVVSILVVGNFLRDKESNWLEGALLVLICVIVAIAAWYYPNPDVATSNGVPPGMMSHGLNMATGQAGLKVQG